MGHCSPAFLAGIGAIALGGPAFGADASAGTLILEARTRLEHFATTPADATASSVGEPSFP